GFRVEDGSLEDFIARARALAEGGERSLPQAMGFAITDRDGIVRHAANPSMIGLSFAANPLFEALRADPARRYVHSRPMVIPPVGQRAIVLGWPLRDRAGAFR